MAPSKEFSTVFRQKIVDAKKSGLSYAAVAKKFDVSKNAVVRIMKKFNDTGSVENKRGRGRKRKLTTRDDSMILREVKKNPQITVKSIKENLNLNVSDRTVIRRIKEKGFGSYFMKRKPCLSKKNIKKRLEFAKKYVGKPLTFWMSVIWSDESKFEVFNQKRRQRVWRTSKDAYKKGMIQSTVKHGGGNTLVWGCFSYSGIGNLVEINGIMTGLGYLDIIKDNLQVSAEKMNIGDNFIFQQDNDPKHTSKVVKAYFSSEGINVLEWPAQSPDLNPIEHLWAILDSKLIRERVTNKTLLFSELQRAWEAIDISLLKSLVESIPKRLQAVIEAKGLNTKY